jgi:ribosomal protein S6--L-glutamate ligase
VLFGPDGPVVVDVNDFPSFRQVPDAAARVARAVLGLASRSGGAAAAPAPPVCRPRPRAVPVPIPVQAARAGEAAL